jgi:Tannase and feruloyl esterase
MHKQYLVSVMALGCAVAASACASGGATNPSSSAGSAGADADAGSSNGNGGGGASGGAAGSPASAGEAGAAGEGQAGSPEQVLPSCDDQLKALDLGKDTTVNLVKSFQPGEVLSLVSPAAEDAPVTPVELCLVKLMVGPGNPGSASDPATSVGIGIEIWLPSRHHWNHRYQALGNGGFAGGADISSLTAIGALRPGPSALFEAGAGFVTSLSDGGHTSFDGSFAMKADGSLNKALLHDFAERAAHEMARATQRLIQQFYGQPAEHSYWNGCSEGGREGLMEALRYPDDFDAVLAGSPALPGLGIGGLWPQVVMQVELGGPMALSKLSAVTAAANAACSGALTGQAERYISNPGACHYDPTTDEALLCASAGGTNHTGSCLTLKEAQTMNKIWYGPTADGTIPSPAVDNGYAPGAVLAAKQLAFGITRGTLPAGQIIFGGLADALPTPLATDVLALALGEPSYAQPTFANGLNGERKGADGWRNLNYAGFANAFEAAATRLSAPTEVVDPDLSAFRARGGRLIMWHGTSDSLLPPQSSVRYYETVATSAGGYAQARDFARFYLAPGFDHCFLPGQVGESLSAPGTSGDPGTGMFEALQRWVEEGEAPDQLQAQSAPDALPFRTRPWCAYPQQLKYLSGDVNTGEFTCE